MCGKSPLKRKEHKQGSIKLSSIQKFHHTKQSLPSFLFFNIFASPLLSSRIQSITFPYLLNIYQVLFFSCSQNVHAWINYFLHLLSLCMYVCMLLRTSWTEKITLAVSECYNVRTTFGVCLSNPIFAWQP